MNPDKDQFKEHKCEACPDTSSFDKLLEPGTNPMFHGWAKAAKDHANASHKFSLAADEWMKNR